MVMGFGFAGGGAAGVAADAPSRSKNSQET
jgi:hypothetical protein